MALTLDIHLLLLLLIAHIFGDVFMYSPKLSTGKRTDSHYKMTGSLLIHSILHAAVVWLILWKYPLQFKTTAAIYFLILHFIIDYLRILIEKNIYQKDELVIFKRRDILNFLFKKNSAEINLFLNNHFHKWILQNIMDQSLHLATIIFFVLMFDNSF